MSTTSTAAARGSVVAQHHTTVTGDPDGPVLLLAHGFGCDQEMWGRLLPHFTDDHRVVLYDHAGAGRSDPAAYDSERYATLDGYADDLLAICAELDLEDVTVVAHSVAAMMAVVAAARDSSRFARLVLIAPSPCYVDDPATGYVGGFSRADVEELLASLDSNYFAWAAAMAPVVMGTPGSPALGEELERSFCSTDPDTAREFARVTFLSDCRPLLGRVDVPTLLLQCAHDALAPLEVGDHLHAAIAGSTLVRLEATGHCPHVSAPEETAAAIRAHLAEQR